MTADARRVAIARAILGLLDDAIIDRAALRVVLAGDPEDAEPGATPRPGVRPRARVVLAGPDALARLLVPPSPDGFAEGYLRGDLEIEGDVMAAAEAGQRLDLTRLGPIGMRRLARWGLELRRGVSAPPPLRRIVRLRGIRHSRARDMAAVRFHYDVGESFYRLWLDRRLTYSCALFPDGTTAVDATSRLDEAQEAKLDLIARKLRLAPGMRLLDIGSGWGSFIGFAGDRYGVEALGVTLSERQSDEANARAAAGDLADRVRSEVRDYRDLADAGAFDAVASIGMFEHVGRSNLPTYFRAAYEALRPGGLFLNHGIARAGSGDRSPLTALRPRDGRFVERYVFPDGELVPVEEAVAVARASGFEVVDVQSLRPHYALTLAAWIARLEAAWPEAVEAAGEEVARTWRLYMSGARLGFERAELDLCQLLLAKPLPDGPTRLPLRPWW